MFSRNKDHAPPPASSPSSSSNKRSGPRAAPSIFSTDLVVTGNLVATGDMQIDGKVEGDIRSGSLTIGEKAYIQGEIVADEVVIRGKVLGSIRARRVQLASTCHVEGNILHEALAVEAGAFFEGHCRHSADPMSEQMMPSERRHSGGSMMGQAAAGPVILKPAAGIGQSSGKTAASPLRPA